MGLSGQWSRGFLDAAGSCANCDGGRLLHFGGWVSDDGDPVTEGEFVGEKDGETSTLGYNWVIVQDKLAEFGPQCTR